MSDPREALLLFKSPLFDVSNPYRWDASYLDLVTECLDDLFWQASGGWSNSISPSRSVA